MLRPQHSDRIHIKIHEQLKIKEKIKVMIAI